METDQNSGANNLPFFNTFLISSVATGNQGLNFITRRLNQDAGVAHKKGPGLQEPPALGCCPTSNCGCSHPHPTAPGWSSIPALGRVIWDQEPVVQRAVQVLLLVSPAPLPRWVGKGPATTAGGYLVQAVISGKAQEKEMGGRVVFLTGVLPGRCVPCAEGR